MSTTRVLIGDCRDVLPTLPEASVQTCVTSPPYWGLRDYGHDGQIGLEASPEAFVEDLVAVFRAVRRVLRDDGTLWLNLGDCYAGARGGNQGFHGQRAGRSFTARIPIDKKGGDLKPKDLVGIPWMVAFALRADGWFLRSDIIWAKPNPMPESVKDRPTKAHEYLFLLSKSETYYYDAAAILERGSGRAPGNKRQKYTEAFESGDEHLRTKSGLLKIGASDVRNRRSVWSVSTQPYDGAHFATYPPKLIEPCIMAGAPAGGVVLDPFAGAFTTGVVASSLGRSFVGIEINPDFAELGRARMAATQPGLPLPSPEAA